MDSGFALMRGPADGWSRWPAPAKLNLFLRILGRRPDGYHELQTVFALLDWGDEVDLRVRADGGIERNAGAAGVSAENDLAVRAARALQQASGTELGADIAVSKRIPMGGGFGGGSSDAATTLRALNALWGLDWTSDRLMALGLGLGADVPVFIGGHSSWAEGLGERLTPLSLPPRHYLLLDPGVHAPTGELFQAPDLTRNQQPLRIADFVAGKCLDNVFEPLLRARDARVDAAMRALARFGRAQLTGSGSGCFVAFEEAGEATAACSALAAEWKVWCAEGVDTSPLLVALQEHSQRRLQAGG